MSQWMEVDGHLRVWVRVPGAAQATHAILTSNMPEGSEGPLSVWLSSPGYWAIHGNLRDMGEDDDVRSVVAWLNNALGELGDRVSDGELTIMLYQRCYHYTLVDGSLQLLIPPLYAEAMAGAQ